MSSNYVIAIEQLQRNSMLSTVAKCPHPPQRKQCITAGCFWSARMSKAGGPRNRPFALLKLAHPIN
jgi:hypothetical protein